MKRKITLLIISSIFILSLIAACEQQTKDQELEDLINKLPSVQRDPLDSNSLSQIEDNISYISAIGKVISFSKDNFIVKVQDQEQKFYIDSSTSIYGGEIAPQQYVNVTYNEADKGEKKIYAFAVTVLNGDPGSDNFEETSVISSAASAEEPFTVTEESTAYEAVTSGTAAQTTELTVQTAAEITAQEQTTPTETTI